MSAFPSSLHPTSSLCFCSHWVSRLSRAVSLRSVCVWLGSFLSLWAVWPAHSGCTICFCLFALRAVGLGVLRSTVYASSISAQLQCKHENSLGLVSTATHFSWNKCIPHSRCQHYRSILKIQRCFDVSSRCASVERSYTLTDTCEKNKRKSPPPHLLPSLPERFAKARPWLLLKNERLNTETSTCDQNRCSGDIIFVIIPTHDRLQRLYCHGTSRNQCLGTTCPTQTETPASQERAARQCTAPPPPPYCQRQ